MYKLPIFTKGVQAFLNLKELVTRLEKSGCVIENLELMPITHEQCSKHYQKMVGGQYYDELQDLLDSCPSVVLEVSGDLDTILDLIGRKTDPKSCSKGSLRYKYGENKGKNAYHRPETFKEVVTDEQNFWGEKGFVAEYRDVQNEQLWQETHIRAVAILKEYGADCKEFFAIVDKYRKAAWVLCFFNGWEQSRPFLKINFFSYLDN